MRFHRGLNKAFEFTVINMSVACSSRTENLKESQFIPSHRLYLIIRACTVKLKTMRRISSRGFSFALWTETWTGLRNLRNLCQTISEIQCEKAISEQPDSTHRYEKKHLTFPRIFSINMHYFKCRAAWHVEGNKNDQSKTLRLKLATQAHA